MKCSTRPDCQDFSFLCRCPSCQSSQAPKRCKNVTRCFISSVLGRFPRTRRTSPRDHLERGCFRNHAKAVNCGSELTSVQPPQSDNHVRGCPNENILETQNAGQIESLDWLNFYSIILSAGSFRSWLICLYVLFSTGSL
jgi:hypothetical protein